MSTLKYWVWLSALTELSPKTRFELLNIFGEPELLYHADENQLLERCRLSERERGILLDKSLSRANLILEKCHEEGISILTLQDAAYPKRLKSIYDPPVVLYVKGRLPAMDEQAAVAIVGTRKCSPYGLKMAQKLAAEITLGGGLVVTGLAAGADSAAAKGALLAGGSCIGVLGCAIDEVFPAWNTELFSDVAAVGALVSEYPQGTPGASHHFPERNRIMSGLSVGAVIVEAPERSGAMITAAMALEQGREVFAVPGNADAPNSFGTNKLIREGATLVTRGWDVLEEYEHRFPARLSKPDAARAAAVESMDKGERETPTHPQRESRHERPLETGRGFAKLRVKTDRKRIDNKNPREYSDLREQLQTLTEPQIKNISAIYEASKHVDDIIDATGLPASAVLSELTILQIKGFVSAESGKRFSLNIRK